MIIPPEGLEKCTPATIARWLMPTTRGWLLSGFRGLPAFQAVLCVGWLVQGGVIVRGEGGYQITAWGRAVREEARKIEA